MSNSLESSLMADCSRPCLVGRSLTVCTNSLSPLILRESQLSSWVNQSGRRLRWGGEVDSGSDPASWGSEDGPDFGCLIAEVEGSQLLKWFGWKM